MDHSYEEIRGVVLDILAGREPVNYPASQFEHLRLGVGEVFARREGAAASPNRRRSTGETTYRDSDVLLEVFWALFREGVITLGSNASNPTFPWFRLTAAGAAIAGGSHAYVFHDVTTYQQVIRQNVPNINDVTITYLMEAMQAFQSGCLLSATVMVGVAAEHTFLLMLEAAETREPWKTRFQNAFSQRTILAKVNKFKNVLDQHLADLPPELKEDLDTHFAGVLSVVRTFRNESGHPTGKIISREQVYVLLQLFISYSKKLYQLRSFFLAP